ncbi:fumarylacetoacetate hydrolase family protein [Nitriliruptor alkaliphilus]|uniref:fumarylacetoacetate hydrolase family protein n=1 Tax=Nitriliruptor alkaliphilus TaxID=427918 RepID=UPI0006975DA1|nr:fumarylacetoacetate hydrolase family protein [Nitriliruptor alkaliphilus]
MKLLSFVHDGRSSFGALTAEDRIVDLQPFLDDAENLQDVLAQERLADAQEVAASAPSSLALDQVELLPVIPEPSKIICVGLNYVAHAEEAGRKVGEHPVIFQRFAGSLAAHGEPIVRPIVSQELDFEGELAVVIGRGGSHIAAEDAMDHVAGYACFNDASIRDWQFHTHQYGMGKNFRKTGAFGPWMVTSDAVPDYRDLEVSTFLNGEQLQSGRLDELAFDIPTLISYVSKALPWNPGDVLATGTPSGIGFKRNPPIFLQPGDRIEVELRGVGRLSNPVADESEGN